MGSLIRGLNGGAGAAFLTMVIGTMVLGLSGCGGGTPTATPEAPPPSVLVVTLAPEAVTETARFAGRVVAAERVELRARVAGFLEQRLFKEGQMVAADDVLFQIERDVHETTVAQRQADLQRVQAEQKNARAQLARGEELLKSNDISQARVDELRAAEAIATAQIAQTQAALRAAEIDLGFTTIVAPISGRVGFAQYTVGNLVGPDSGSLATIVQIDPIYVQFPLTQRDILQFRQRANHNTDTDNANAAKVQVRLADGSLYAETGQLNFVDVTVDPGTDTVLVRAEFANPDGILISGQFVGVELALGEPEQLLTVPNAALQIDQGGHFVLVVDDNNAVQMKRVTLGQDRVQRSVVRGGLVAGDQVIVEGVQKVRPGQTVSASPWTSPVGN